VPGTRRRPMDEFTRLGIVLGVALLAVLPPVAAASSGRTELPASLANPTASSLSVMRGSAEPGTAGTTAPFGAVGSATSVPPPALSLVRDPAPRPSIGISHRVGPHPYPVPAGAPPSYNGHYYAGVVYDGPSENATEVQTTLFVPADRPQPADFYYVLLSVWDNAGSYDQVGFTNNYGAWGLAYSTTNNCAANYYYSPNATELAGGQNYTFKMTLSGGFVDFAVTNASGSSIWVFSQYTGGTEFVIAGFYTCISGSYYDYTDYEEVYSTTAPEPPYDFFFQDDSGTPIGSVTNWTSWNANAPTGILVYIDGVANSTGCPASCPIVIANEPYYLYFPNAAGSLRVEPVSPPTAAAWNVTVAEFAPDAPISLSLYAVPTGWTVKLSVRQGAPAFSSGISVEVPSSTATGWYSIGVNATDGLGSYARISLNATVVPALAVALSAAPGSGGADLGQPILLSAIATGGSHIYGYDWTALPPGCTPSIGPSLRCVPSAAGSFGIGVTVRDSLDYSKAASINYTVDPDPSLGPPQASVPSVDLGQTVTFTAAPVGGSGSDTFDWVTLPTGCVDADTLALLCEPTAAGTFPVAVNVTDSNGFTASSPKLEFVAYVPPAVGAPSESPATIDAGMNLTLSVDYGGGSGGYRFVWQNLPAGCTPSSGFMVNCSSVRAGTFEVSVEISDSDGGSMVGPPTTVIVASDPVISGSGPGRSTVSLGAELVVFGTASGGVPPYSYTWSGMPPGCASTDGPVLTCTPTSTGTFNVQVVATDQAGLQASKIFGVTIGSSGSSSGASPTYRSLEIGGAIAVLAAVGLTVWVLRRRRR